MINLFLMTILAIDPPKLPPKVPPQPSQENLLKYDFRSKETYEKALVKLREASKLITVEDSFKDLIIKSENGDTKFINLNNKEKSLVILYSNTRFENNLSIINKRWINDKKALVSLKFNDKKKEEDFMKNKAKPCDIDNALTKLHELRKEVAANHEKLAEKLLTLHYPNEKEMYMRTIQEVHDSQKLLDRRNEKDKVH